MERSDFHIGLEFWCGGRRWRCTDVGSRVVIAIRIDEVTIVSMNSETRERTKRVVDGAEAERDGWFDGPPYPVAESVFDEDSMEACELEPETESAP